MKVINHPIAIDWAKKGSDRTVYAVKVAGAWIEISKSFSHYLNGQIYLNDRDINPE